MPDTDDLNALSYVVLTLIGRNGASAHDLVQMARRGQRLYWAGAASKMYAEPKRLERLGYLRARKEPGKTRQRTYYTLTEQGYAALEAWLTRPSPFPKIQSEAAVRIHASDLANDLGQVAASISAMRGEIEEQTRLLDESDRRAPMFPHRQLQITLLHSLGRRLLGAHLEWIEEVEHQLGDPAETPKTAPRGRPAGAHASGGGR
jgi:DNA-binding PadR family transcriptional regulator